MLISQQEILLRIFLALIIGSMIGYERQTMHKYAGTRTYSLVCVGACVASIMSLMLLDDYQLLANVDPARIPAQILSGIGFLGAGAIMKNKGNVSGLTTAAGLWVVATAGMAIGYGYYYLTVITWLALLIILYAMRLLESYTKSKKSYCLSIKLSNHVDTLPLILKKLKQDNIFVDNIDMGELDSEHRYLDIALYCPRKLDIAILCNSILNLSVEIKNITYY